MCETSQTIGKISESLAKAQSEMTPAVFDSKNPHFNSRYASLKAIVEACRPALTKYGIAIIQATSVEGEPVRVKLTTVLAHVSGEFFRTTLSIKPMADTAQSVGSAISYARRYSLAALVGIVSEEDDDGNAANEANNKVTPIRKVPEKPKVETPKTEPSTQLPGGTTPAPETKSPVGATPKVQDNPGNPDQVQNPGPKANQGNPRVLKLREIFTLSGKLGQSPSDMKEAIGNILKLGKPIRESSEIKDAQLDVVIDAFRKALDNMNKSDKKEAA